MIDDVWILYQCDKCDREFDRDPDEIIDDECHCGGRIHRVGESHPSKREGDPS